jgi:hypothetical protein
VQRENAMVSDVVFRYFYSFYFFKSSLFHHGVYFMISNIIILAVS